MAGFDAGAYGASGIAADYDTLNRLPLGHRHGGRAPGRARRRTARCWSSGSAPDGSPSPSSTPGSRSTASTARPRWSTGSGRSRRGTDPGFVGNLAETDAGRGFSLVVLAVNTIFALPDQVRLYPATQRYARPAELDLMGQLAWFDRESRWADWTGADFTRASPGHVTVCRR